MAVVTFTFDIPEDEAQRIAIAVCASYGYDPSSGQTPVEFTKEVVFRWLADTTREFEAKVAADTARNAVLNNPDDPLAGAALTGETG